MSSPHDCADEDVMNAINDTIDSLYSEDYTMDAPEVDREEDDHKHRVDRRLAPQPPVDSDFSDDSIDPQIEYDLIINRSQSQEKEVDIFATTATDTPVETADDDTPDAGLLSDTPDDRSTQPMDPIDGQMADTAAADAQTGRAEVSADCETNTATKSMKETPKKKKIKKWLPPKKQKTDKKVETIEKNAVREETIQKTIEKKPNKEVSEKQDTNETIEKKSKKEVSKKREKKEKKKLPKKVSKSVDIVAKSDTKSDKNKCKKKSKTRIGSKDTKFRLKRKYYGITKELLEQLFGKRDAQTEASAESALYEAMYSQQCETWFQRQTRLMSAATEAGV